MFGFLKKAFGLYLDTYGAPGAGVTVYSAPDSVTDIFRLEGMRLPLTDEPAPRKPRTRGRRASIWGGNGAAHIVSYRVVQACEPKSSGC